jgi:hypothetical protein
MDINSIAGSIIASLIGKCNRACDVIILEDYF